MSMVTGLQAGAAQRDRNLEAVKLIDPGQAMAAMAQAGGAINSRAGMQRGGGTAPMRMSGGGGASPSSIWQKSAEKVLTEAERRLKDEREQLALEKERLGKEKMELENAKMKAEETRAAEKHDVEQGVAKDKAIQTRFESGMANAGLWKGVETAGVQQEYDNALQRAGAGDYSGMIANVNKYGNQKSNIKSITPDPSGSGQVIIELEGQAKGLLINPQQLGAFWAGFSPKFQAAAMTAVNASEKTAAATTTKQQEMNQKISAQGDLAYKNDHKIWADKYVGKGPMGNTVIDPNAPPEPKRENYPGAPKPGAAPAGQGGQGGQINAKDGEWHKNPGDGRYYRFIKEGAKGKPVFERWDKEGAPTQPTGPKPAIESEKPVEQASAIDGHAQKWLELISTGTEKDRAKMARFIQQNREKLGYGMNEVQKRAGEIVKLNKPTEKTQDEAASSDYEENLRKKYPAVKTQPRDETSPWVQPVPDSTWIPNGPEGPGWYKSGEKGLDRVYVQVGEGTPAPQPHQQPASKEKTYKTPEGGYSNLPREAEKSPSEGDGKVKTGTRTDENGRTTE
jgi:hypothetical protein